MGIESDQLVYDYLSRVGDLAQQQQLPSGARMRLVSTLRGEIDRQRHQDGTGTPAAVRRIIGRLGTPDELVAAAAESGDGSVPLPSARSAERGAGGGAGGGQWRNLPRPRSGLLRKEPKDSSRRGASEVPESPGEGREREESRGSRENRGSRGSRKGSGGAADAAAAEDTPAPAHDWPDPSAPHVLGLEQQGPSGGEPDWWRIAPGSFGDGERVPGFVGGVEIPEIFRPPRPPKPRRDPDADEEADDRDDRDDVDGGKSENGEDREGGSGADKGGEQPAKGARVRLGLPRLRRRKAAATAPEPAAATKTARFAHPLLLLAAALLVGGAVTGSWLALAGGWLLAYSSRTLSRAEAKWAAMGLPGVVVAATVVWVWGRMEGRWGEPIAEGGMGDVLVGAWPVVLRVAAVASALYLVWRARGRAA
ncbi:hypothetical protein [Streptomyces sp. NPDC001787]|uniref:hypothetical protein n=1 Tax=Streptomyces sp. NPDC001787 TaxID=3154523 RepID=UPI003326957F